LTNPITGKHRQHRPIPLLNFRQLRQRQSRPPDHAMPANITRSRGQTQHLSSSYWDADVKHLPGQHSDLSFSVAELVSLGSRRR
ncbi:hypothetical protein, partial [Catellatospora vulcania]|uniref:hypothetical protein n=1 Tax=Catellatospora vulcania TaxID=1460450 RepID=UPI001E5EA1CC